MNAAALAWLALQQEEVPPGVQALVGGVFLILLLVLVGVYVFFAVCLMKIAQKTNADNAWWAWIPILNLVLMLNIAQKPVWWIILMFVPLVNIVIILLVDLAIAEARGKGAIWGVILFLVPIIGLPYLAFSE